ncbi:Inner membrane protein YpjD [Saliniradius amylolyticus]|uniref:Inner membrane protein YpjD n=1 Tax=Saliniradius amylolyticus TaxID=2183582 RepID=A0A2S2E5X7_9ALTE|nr:cytochrome c biogenesis protein CcsA [Saliniradius amylolyticus]AWL12367.1 Inner membrane protein YpjD [Saliniradius amylolyticus]
MFWLGLVAALLYLAAAGMIGRQMLHHQQSKQGVSLTLGIVAVLLHLLILREQIFAVSGQNMSLMNVTALVAWMISVAMTIASFSVANLLLLPVVYGFTAIVVLVNSVVPGHYMMHIEMAPGLLVHILLGLFAYGALVISMLYALQLAYINHQLKHKNLSMATSSLPPLMAVESILFKLLSLGTVLLTLSLISGFVFLEDMFAQGQSHKTVLSIVAWLIFCITLAGHYQFGWRGKPVSIATIAGALLLTLAYFGSRFVREFLL